jgi:hypothetical protein
MSGHLRFYHPPPLPFSQKKMTEQNGVLLPFDVINHILLQLDCPHDYYHIARQLCQRSRYVWVPRTVDAYFVTLDSRKFVSCMWQRDHLKNAHMVVVKSFIKFNIKMSDQLLFATYCENECTTNFMVKHYVPVQNCYWFDYRLVAVTFGGNNVLTGGYVAPGGDSRCVSNYIPVHIERGHFVSTQLDGTFQKVKHICASFGGSSKDQRFVISFDDPKYNMSVKKGKYLIVNEKLIL